jgi:hypothetical protein
MSLEKAREFLGMASDEEEASDGVDAEEEEEEEDNLSFCDEVEEEAADFHPDQSIAAGAEGAQHGLYGPYGASSAGERCLRFINLRLQPAGLLWRAAETLAVHPPQGGLLLLSRRWRVPKARSF